MLQLFSSSAVFVNRVFSKPTDAKTYKCMLLQINTLITHH